MSISLCTLCSLKTSSACSSFVHKHFLKGKHTHAATHTLLLSASLSKRFYFCFFRPQRALWRRYAIWWGQESKCLWRPWWPPFSEQA